MIVSKAELIASLHTQVRLLLHLAGKIDPAALDDGRRRSSAVQSSFSGI